MKMKIIIKFIILTIVLVGIFIYFIFRDTFLVPSETQSWKSVVDDIKKECKNENFQYIALNSLINENNNYRRLTQSDLNGQSDNYFGKVKILCSLLLSNSKIEMSKVSDKQWSFRFIIKPQPMGSSMSYSLIYFEDQWSFVLPRSASL